MTVVRLPDVERDENIVVRFADITPADGSFRVFYLERSGNVSEKPTTKRRTRRDTYEEALRWAQEQGR